MTLVNEPKIAVRDMLRSRLPDPNPDRELKGDGSKKNWIHAGWPRSDLGKNSYPRISIIDIGQPGNIIDIGRSMEFMSSLQIDVWVWADRKDPMVVSSWQGDTYLEGGKLVDAIAVQVRDSLDLYKGDLSDATNQFHNLRIIDFADVPPEGRGAGQAELARKRIGIELTWVNCPG